MAGQAFQVGGTTGTKAQRWESIIGAAMQRETRTVQSTRVWSLAGEAMGMNCHGRSDPNCRMFNVKFQNVNLYHRQ